MWSQTGAEEAGWVLLVQVRVPVEEVLVLAVLLQVQEEQEQIPAQEERALVRASLAAFRRTDQLSILEQTHEKFNERYIPCYLGP